jgi:hypothetical protein
VRSVDLVSPGYLEGMSREARGPHAASDDESGGVVDLTGVGEYNLLNESEDERRYQWSWWVPIGVVTFIALLVAVMLLA